MGEVISVYILIFTLGGWGWRVLIDFCGLVNYQQGYNRGFIEFETLSNSFVGCGKNTVLTQSQYFPVDCPSI